MSHITRGRKDNDEFLHEISLPRHMKIDNHKVNFSELEQKYMIAIGALRKIEASDDKSSMVIIAQYALEDCKEI